MAGGEPKIVKEKDKKNRDFSSFMYGYVPPHDDAIEKGVLGYMMQFEDKVQLVKLQLVPGDFYSTATQQVCAAIFALDENGVFPDAVMVTRYLHDQELLDAVGGPYFVVSCTDAPARDIDRYCKFVKQFALQRQVIRLAQDMIGFSMEGEDVFKLIEDFRIEVDAINAYMNSTDAHNLEKIALETASATIYRQINENPTLTYMEAWDMINGELFAGGVYFLAARPGMGKTALVVQLIRNMARRFPVGFVNAEMTEVQMCIRWCCNYADIPNDAIKIIPGQPLEIPDELKWRYQAALEEFTKQQLHMLSDETDIDKVISKIHYWVKTLGCKTVIIDYLQILRVRAELLKYMTEVQALNYILLRIRDTAKRLKVPIIVLSQLNRDLYKRGGNKEPGLSDLKGSGMIEEVAYQIAFLHRPEYYGIKEDEYSETTTKLAYLIIAKHRDGPMGRVMLKALLPMSKFIKWESDYIPWTPMVKERPENNFSAGDFDEGYDEAAPF